MALQCGFPHPRFMLQDYQLTSADITEAEAYHALEPYGDVRQDLRVGMVMSLLHAVNKGKSDKNHLWYDWFPNGDMPDAEWEALQERMKQERKRKEVQAAAPQSSAAIALFHSYNQRFKKRK